MAERRKVIDPKCFPSNPFRFISLGILWWLFLDRINAPTWVFGAIGAVYVLAVGGSISMCVKEDQVKLRELDGGK